MSKLEFRLRGTVFQADPACEAMSGVKVIALLPTAALPLTNQLVLQGPLGVAVSLGVSVAVSVGVKVGVAVFVSVGVFEGVAVGVLVALEVGVLVAVAVNMEAFRVRVLDVLQIAPVAELRSSTRTAPFFAVVNWISVVKGKFETVKDEGVEVMLVPALKTTKLTVVELHPGFKLPERVMLASTWWGNPAFKSDNEFKATVKAEQLVQTVWADAC